MAFTQHTYQEIFDNIMLEKDYMTTLTSLSPYNQAITVTLDNSKVTYTGITKSDSIVFTDVTLPVGLVTGRMYYILDVDVDFTANISESLNGTAISFSVTNEAYNAFKSAYFNNLVMDLNSTSKVSEHRLWAFITAVIISQFEQNLADYRVDIEELKEAFSYGSSKWYIDNILKYQDGDPLVVLDINNPDAYRVGYETLDTSKNIIASCTINEFSNVIQVKVRRRDSDILTNYELLRFNDYMKKIKVAGTRVGIINYAADDLKLGLDITYNGQYKLTDVQNAVNSAINNYITNIEFDSKLMFSKLIDAIQAITIGNRTVINDVVLFSAEAKDVINTNYRDILHDINDKIQGSYSSLAGYFKLDTNLTEINYIAV